MFANQNLFFYVHPMAGCAYKKGELILHIIFATLQLIELRIILQMEKYFVFPFITSEYIPWHYVTSYSILSRHAISNSLKLRKKY